MDQADKSIPRITKAEQTSSESSSSLALNPKLFMNIKKYLVNVISSMSYDNVEVQNKVRACGFLRTNSLNFTSSILH